jgi:hypothetical protein
MPEKDEKIRFCGLWKNKSKDGKTDFLGGSAGPVRLIIFKNGFKEKETDPDFVAYLAPNKKPEKKAPAKAAAEDTGF